MNVLITDDGFAEDGWTGCEFLSVSALEKLGLEANDGGRNRFSE